MPELVRFMTTPQREIWNDKTRGAKSVKLFLPSELSTASREKMCETGLDKIEEEMREAELKVALEDLRQALRARTATNRFRHRNTMGQKALMRGQGVLRQIDIRIMKAKLCYRYARNTLLRLRGHGVWEKVWNVLEDADVRGINERAAMDEEEADREHLQRLRRIVEGGIVLRPCSFQIFSSFPPAILIWSFGSNSSSYSRCDPHSGSCPSKHCASGFVPLMHALWGFRNEGLLSVPQIKHMSYATMLLSYCAYCLSLYLLSFTYFFLH
jgi:hypothetical protein